MNSALSPLTPLVPDAVTSELSPCTDNSSNDIKCYMIPCFPSAQLSFTLTKLWMHMFLKYNNPKQWAPAMACRPNLVYQNNFCGHDLLLPNIVPHIFATHTLLAVKSVFPAWVYFLQVDVKESIARRLQARWRHFLWACSGLRIVIADMD